MASIQIFKICRLFHEGISIEKTGSFVSATLWNYILPYEPKILSAPSRQIDSRIAKHDWVQRELSNTELLLRSAKHKRDFADTNHILIDDRIDNIEGWVGAGGIGIHHKSAKETIKKLKKLGL